MVQSPTLRSGRYYSYSVFWDADERKVLNISRSFEFTPNYHMQIQECCLLLHPAVRVSACAPSHQEHRSILFNCQGQQNSRFPSLNWNVFFASSYIHYVQRKNS